MAPTMEQQEGTDMVTFMSYNSTGINTIKCQWINEICEENDVDYFSIQEHFKSTKSTDKFFRDNFRYYYSYVKNGHRSPGQDSGRAKAGLAQLSTKHLAVRNDRVSTHSFRIQAQILNFQQCQILWINSYFPTDPQIVQNYDPGELLELHGEVEDILTNTVYTDVVWAGDLNWDMTRNSQYSKIMKNFVDKLELEPLCQ